MHDTWQKREPHLANEAGVYVRVVDGDADDVLASNTPLFDDTLNKSNVVVGVL